MRTANRHNRGLQYADQILAGFDTSESRILVESLRCIGIHICDRTGSGHADESADIVASFHLAQVGDVGTGSGDTISKLLAVLIKIAPDSAADRETT